MTLLVGDHVWEELLHCTPMTDEVDVEKLSECLNWNIEDGISIADTCVVDQD